MTPRLVAMAVAAMSIIALLPLPYAYYMLLRVVVFGAAIYCGLLGYKSNRELSIALFVAAAVFNPLIPVHLFREAWAFLNLATAGLFGYYAWKIKPRDVL